jgi:hypothetical protein
MATFEDIKKANGTILTTKIKEKDYAEVNQRIKAFRMVHPNGTIETRIVKMEDGIVLMQTTVMDDQGNVLGTGFAQEKESSSFINKTSYIENCETSSVGRALGMCGFGIDTSVASYEEVMNALENQQANAGDVKPQKDDTNYSKLLLAKIKELNIDINAFAKQKNLNGKSSQAQYKKAYEELLKEIEELGF